MNESLMLALTAFAGGMFGALLCGLLFRPSLGKRLSNAVAAQANAVMLPLLRSHLDAIPATVVPLALGSSDSVTPDADPQVLARLIASMLDTHLASQRQAWQDAIQGVPQIVQRALQIELDFMAVQQLQRDAAAAQRQDEQAELLRTLVSKLTSTLTRPIAPPVTPPFKPEFMPPLMTSRAQASAPPAVSARPPELLLTPLPRPQPTYDEPELPPELSDEELDALPPELPMPDKLRRRVLPAPKKPALRSL